MQEQLKTLRRLYNYCILKVSERSGSDVRGTAQRVPRGYGTTHKKIKAQAIGLLSSVEERRLLVKWIPSESRLTCRLRRPGSRSESASAMGTAETRWLALGVHESESRCRRAGGASESDPSDVPAAALWFFWSEQRENERFSACGASTTCAARPFTLRPLAEPMNEARWKRTEATVYGSWMDCTVFAPSVCSSPAPAAACSGQNVSRSGSGIERQLLHSSAILIATCHFVTAALLLQYDP